MMSKRIFTLSVTLILFSAFIDGQNISDYLVQVRENNPEIIAYRRLLEARKNESRTGIAPLNPLVSFGYMPGQTEDIGIKRTWSVTQSFSFPTKYLLQNKISRSTIILAEQEFNLGMLDIMLNAKLATYNYIYDQRILSVLSERKIMYDKLRSGWEKLLSTGGATILEYNKILLELASLNLRITSTESEITVLREKLLYMSGNGTLPDVNVYELYPESDPETLLSDKSRMHPAFLLPESEYQISLQQVKLSKSGSLPEFEAGVASEIVPGENYTGPVAGMTIPLWANTNRVKSARSRAEYSAAVRDARLTELKANLKSEYERMMAYKKGMEEIGKIVGSGDDREFLNKAIEAGEISLTDYFAYLNTSFQAEDKYYELEYEYHRTLASLYDHELVNLR